MKIVKNIILLVVVLVLAYVFSVFAGELYSRTFKQSGTWIDLRGIVGLPLSFTFFLILLFTAFGDRHKYWWIAILLIPAAIFEIRFDLAHLYFPILLGLIGWLLGLAICRLRSKLSSPR